MGSEEMNSMVEYANPQVEQMVKNIVGNPGYIAIDDSDIQTTFDGMCVNAITINVVDRNNGCGAFLRAIDIPWSEVSKDLARQGKSIMAAMAYFICPKSAPINMAEIAAFSEWISLHEEEFPNMIWGVQADGGEEELIVELFYGV